MPEDYSQAFFALFFLSPISFSMALNSLFLKNFQHLRLKFEMRPFLVLQLKSMIHQYSIQVIGFISSTTQLDFIHFQPTGFLHVFENHGKSITSFRLDHDHNQI